jgi:hypothetical protein
MIEFECPSCGVALRVSDDKAGKSARCPKCREPIRAPAAKPAAKTNPQPVPDTGGAGFEFVDDEPAPPSVKQKVTAEKPAPRPAPVPSRPPDPSPLDDDSGESEVGDGSRPRKRKKRRKRRRASSSSAPPPQIPAALISGLLMLTVVGVWGAAMCLKWLGGVFLSGLFALALAFIILMCGRVWFLAIAYGDDATTGTLCLICWPYTIYYLLTNLEETWKPFALEALGGTLVAFSFCGGALYDKNDFASTGDDGPNFVQPDDDKDDAPGPGVPPVNMPGQPPRQKRRRYRRGRQAPTVANAILRNSAARRAAVSSTARQTPTHLWTDVPGLHGAEQAST